MEGDAWAPLEDSFGRRHDYLRVSLTDRCNFRCLYCLPEEGVVWKERDEILRLEEIERLVRVFARLGVDKVRLTGGEPTVRKGWLGLVPKLAQIGGLRQLAVTTNGTGLARHARALKEAGATGVNVSLDSLDRGRFLQITRRDNLEEVLQGIDAAIDAGLKTKVNVVVLPGLNSDELPDMVEFVRNRDAQIRFIEFMPFLGNRWSSDRVVGYREMLGKIGERHRLTPLVSHPSDVAKEFRVEGMRGTVGFVTSVTESFCSDCNRVRLTADGQLKTCLFLPPEISLRDAMRDGATDEELAAAIRSALASKWAGHPPMDKWSQLDRLSMVQIGG